MLPHGFLPTLFAAICLCPAACQSQQQPDKQPSGQQATAKTATSRATYDSLHMVLAGQYTHLTAGARKKLRETLREQAVWPFDALCPDTEPGTHITLRGRVTDAQEMPVPGARLHIFHTDHRGYYSPLDSATGRMLENDPRLEGFLLTDSLGRFEIRTVRPANYPVKYEGRLIPQHIHVNIDAPGFQKGIFQVVFDDDPAMLTQHWKDWAVKGNHPIVQWSQTANGVEGAVELKLQR